MKKASKTKSYRSRQLATIHVLKAQLRLDDDLYRDLLERITGQRSAAKLDAQGRRAVMDELRRRTGENVTRMRNAVPAPGEPENVREEMSGMVAKVGCMLDEANRPWAYAHGMARKMFKVQRVEWCTPEQLHRLIAALVYDKKRREKKSTGLG